MMFGNVTLSYDYSNDIIIGESEIFSETNDCQ